MIQAQNDHDRAEADHDLHEHLTEHNSEVIAAGVAGGINKVRLNFLDKRLLILYVLFTVFVVLSLTWQNHQSDQLRQVVRSNQAQVVAQQSAQHQENVAVLANCQNGNTQAVKFNKIIDQLITNATNSTGITPAQKAQAIATYSQLHLPIADCAALVAQ